MTQHRAVRRPARGRSRGQSIVLVAIAGIALMGITGLALDGGYEAGNYRVAQNATDAGALAAARLIFSDSRQSTPTVPTLAQMRTASNTEVVHNNAVVGNSSGGALLNSSSVDNFVPDSGVGEKAQGSLAVITAVGGLVTLSASDSSATGKVSSSSASTSGQVDLLNIASPVPVSLMCLQSSLAYPPSANLGVWSGSSSCTGGLLGVLNLALGLLGAVSGSAGVNLSPQSTNSYIPPTVPHDPHTIASNALASVNVGALGVGLTASAANVVSQVGQSASVVASQDFNLANLSTGLLGLGVSSSLVTMHAELDYNAATGQVSAPAPTCDPGSITIGVLTLPVLSSCHISGLPVSLLGLVGLSDITSTITSPSPCSGLSCTETGCFLKLTALSGSLASVCIGSFDLQAAGHKMSGSDAAGDTALANSITVTAYVNTPTFFMSVFGWRRTQPTATTSAAVLQVADESDTAFALAPYAMPTVAKNMLSPFATEPLTVGHEYYLYGTSMQSNSPVDKFASTWQGQVSGSSGHQVGAILTSVAGSATVPSTYVSGGDYFLLPVIDPASAVVQYYAVFKTVSGHPSWGQLVNNIAVQANPSTTWSPDAGGSAAAVTVKVTQ